MVVPNVPTKDIQHHFKDTLIQFFLYVRNRTK